MFAETRKEKSLLGRRQNWLKPNLSLSPIQTREVTFCLSADTNHRKQMKYIILTMDWNSPVYFCRHSGKGFTVSTDPKRAMVFTGKKEAEIARNEFASQSGMTCRIKRRR
jgi:hypothetical protein